MVKSRFHLKSKRCFTLVILFALNVILSNSVQAQLVQKKKLSVDVKEVKREKGGAGQEKNVLNRSAIFAVEVEKKLVEGIDKTLKFYSKQVGRLTPGSPSRLQMQIRILELNLEQATYVRSEEERIYDKRYQAWVADGGKGNAPKIDTRKSFNHWRAVIKQSDVIMKEYPRHDDADRTIYTKAFALSFIGQEKEAAKIYTQLIETYPNSKVAGDAYSSLGDYFFDRNDFRNALNNYTKAMKFKQSDQYLWAVFKIAWCYYNLGKNDLALGYWKRVVAEARTSKKFSGLREEALRDMVYAYAELKDVAGAISYYRANGGDKYLGGLITLLAQELADDGNFAEAIKTYKLFQKLLPTNLECPGAQKEIVALAYDLGKIDQVWQELILMYKLYGSDGEWQDANKENRKEVLEARVLVKEQILYYAKVLHKRGQDADSVPIHQFAAKGYEIFLKTYPQARELVEVKFNLADIEFFLKKYRDAGRQYLEITLRGPKNAEIFDAQSKKPSNIHQTSAVYMVDAYARDFLPEFEKMQKTKPNFKEKEKPLTEKAKNYIRACSTYMKYYPNDGKLRKTCEVDVSKIYYLSGDKENSRKNLMLVATKYPKEKDGPEAAEFLIPLYADDKTKLLDIADTLLKVPEYRKGALGEKLMALKRGAQKEAVEGEKEPLKRAQAFQKLAEDNPNDPEADVLWYKAADNYFKAGVVSSAIAAYLVIPKKYPKSKLAADALLDVAFVFERQLKFGNAAAYFDQFAGSNPKDKRAKGAKAKACDLLVAEGGGKAGKVCGEYIGAYPSEAKDTAWKLVLSAERAKEFPRMVTLIEKVYFKTNGISANDRINADYKIYKNLGGAEKKSAAVSILSVFNKNKGSVSGSALRYSGHVIFDSVNGIMGSYVKKGLVGGTVDRLQKSIEAKGQALIQLKNEYGKVLASEDSFYGVAALHQLGLAHEVFADALAKPPAITGAKTEEVAAQLAPQVDALKKEAQGYYEKAFSLVKKYSVYSDFSRKVVSGFYRVKGTPVRFDDWIVEPAFIEAPTPASVKEAVQFRSLQ